MSIDGSELRQARVSMDFEVLKLEKGQPGDSSKHSANGSDVLTEHFEFLELLEISRLVNSEKFRRAT